MLLLLQVEHLRVQLDLRSGLVVRRECVIEEALDETALPRLAYSEHRYIKFRYSLFLHFNYSFLLANRISFKPYEL